MDDLVRETKGPTGFTVETAAVREFKLVAKNRTPISFEVNPAFRRLRILKERLSTHGSSQKDDFQALHIGDYAQLLQVMIRANSIERSQIIESHLRGEEQLLTKIVNESDSEDIRKKLNELPDPRCSVNSQNITEILTHLSVLYELQEAKPDNYPHLLEQMRDEVLVYLRASQLVINTQFTKREVASATSATDAREHLQSIASAEDIKFDRKVLGDLLKRLKAVYPNEPGKIGVIGRQGEQVSVEITFEEGSNLYFLSKAAADKFQQVTSNSPNFVLFRGLIDDIRLNDPKIFTLKLFQGSLVVEDPTINGPEIRSDSSGKTIVVPPDIFKLYQVYMHINAMNDSVVDAHNKPLSTPEHRGNAHNAFGVSADKFAKRISHLVDFVGEK